MLWHHIKALYSWSFCGVNNFGVSCNLCVHTKILIPWHSTDHAGHHSEAGEPQADHCSYPERGADPSPGTAAGRGQDRGGQPGVRRRHEPQRTPGNAGKGWLYWGFWESCKNLNVNFHACTKFPSHFLMGTWAWQWTVHVQIFCKIPKNRSKVQQGYWACPVHQCITLQDIVVFTALLIDTFFFFELLWLLS